MVLNTTVLIGDTINEETNIVNKSENLLGISTIWRLIREEDFNTESPEITNSGPVYWKAG